MGLTTILLACAIAYSGVPDGARVDGVVVFANSSEHAYAIAYRQASPECIRGPARTRPACKAANWVNGLVRSCEGSAVVPTGEKLTAPFEVRFGPVDPLRIEDPTLGPGLPVLLFDSSTYPTGTGPRHFRLVIDQAGAVTATWVNGAVQLPPYRVC